MSMSVGLHISTYENNAIKRLHLNFLFGKLFQFTFDLNLNVRTVLLAMYHLSVWIQILDSL